jgi:hypothetical protein
MKVIFQLWQIWNDNGNEFLIGTYFTRKRASLEQQKIEKDCNLNVQYIIRKERVIE